MADDALKFLRLLYPKDVPDGMRLLIWTLPDKTSHWCATVEEAATIAVQRTATKANVYLGAGLGVPHGARPQTQRVKNDDVLAIPALWIDIDYQDGDAHKKKNLPTQDEARGLIAEISKLRAPSIVVHSGHGYQAWWLLDAPWLLPDVETRHTASETQKGWLYRVRDVARAHGWDVDATIDLARVMRVPGTMNLKGDPIPVTIVSSDRQAKKRYPTSEFAEFIGYVPEKDRKAPQARQETRQTAQRVVGASLTLDPSAQPPFDKWVALTENDRKVLRTWKRDRADFKDTSPSSYDMALASFTVAAGWNDQEITDLLIACRRFHGDDLKLREDYYRRTIDRARSTVDYVRTEDAIDESDATSEDGLDRLSKLFGVRIERIVKYLGDPPVFTMTLMLNGDKRDITLGGIETIMTQRRFRSAIASVVNVIIPKCSEIQWEKRAQAILNVMEEHELGPESTPAGAARAWLEDYLQHHRASEEWEPAVLAKRPYLHDGYVHVSLSAVAFWLRSVQGERITTRELSRYMQMAGYEQHTQWVNVEGKKPTTRSVWRQRVAT